MDDVAPCYKRVLLKLSGESLKGDKDYGIASPVISDIIDDVCRIHDMGVQLALVIGGGNFFRGALAGQLGIDRAQADYMGMLATVMNGIALRDLLEHRNKNVRLISGLEIPKIAESFSNKRVRHHLDRGRIVIFAAGTGNPFFTTDTAGALRAAEIKADVFLKATMVDGVYSDDPKKVKNVVRYDSISYDQVIAKGLKVMDATAVTISKDNHILIKTFNITKKGNLIKAVSENKFGTLINLKG